MYEDTAFASETVTVNANKAPVCDFTWQDYPKSNVTYFTPRCTDPDGRIMMYHWSLGDGTETTSPRAYGKYQEGGTYTVTLTAYDDSQEPGTVTKSVTVQR
jgi:PKD repeat protein